MPKHTQVITIEITPERFLENCSDDELKELDLLIQSERYQSRIREREIGFKQRKYKDEKKEKLYQEEILKDKGKSYKEEKYEYNLNYKSEDELKGIDLRYMDKIIYEWNKKGFKTKEDVDNLLIEADEFYTETDDDLAIDLRNKLIPEDKKEKKTKSKKATGDVEQES
jgi:hypothetical protein